MKQSKIEETIDESFNRLIDIMIKFPKNPYHINLEEIFFKGKADLIHKLEKIINQKDKQIDLMAEEIRIPVIEPIITIKKFGIKPENKFTNTTRYMTKEEVKQYFERKAEE